MGAGNSKSAPGPSHTWSSETPVSFSSELINSLQSSSETDGTRAKQLELHIQARVAEELKRLHAAEHETLKKLEEKISSEPAPTPSEGDHLRSLGREAVQKDVSELRKKLEQRKKIAELDENVESAKQDVTKCLRDHDRRPLDCWKEVETFKTEVRRLEGAWVEKIVR